MTEQKAHAEYSASGSSRWLNCPGSHRLCKTVPPLPESKYAAEGTLAHECLELLLSSPPCLPDGELTRFTPEMFEHASDAASYINVTAGEKSCEILCETKIDASPFICPGQFGTCDAAIVELFGELEVIDYKYGAGIAVDPREADGRLNSQLAYYALGLSEKYHHNFSHVKITIIQPRAYHESGETIRSTVASMEELLSWRDIFKRGYFATLEQEPVFRAGKWCRFCPASLTCPELKDQSFKEAQIAFSDSSGLLAPLPSPSLFPDLGKILDACEKLEEWISKVRGHAFDVLDRGETVSGWKLVQKRGTRKWTGDQDKMVDEVLEKFGADALEEPTLKSPAQLEKTFPKNKDVKAWLEANTTVVSTGVTLAREEDKRPAITKMLDIFGEIK